MPIRVQCGQCGKVCQAKDEWAGKRLKCPGCAQPIAVPGAAAVPVPGTAAAITPVPAFKSAPKIARPAPLGPERTSGSVDLGSDLLADGGTNLGLGPDLAALGSPMAPPPVLARPSKQGGKPQPKKTKTIVGIVGGLVGVLVVLGVVFVLVRNASKLTGSGPGANYRYAPGGADWKPGMPVGDTDPAGRTGLPRIPGSSIDDTPVVRTQPRTGTRPVWTADPAIVSQLAPEIAVDKFFLRLPKDAVAKTSPQGMPAGARSFIWEMPGTNSDGIQTGISLAVQDQNNPTSNDTVFLSALSGVLDAKLSAVCEKIGMVDPKREPVEFGTLIGAESVRVRYSGSVRGRQLYAITLLIVTPTNSISLHLFSFEPPESSTYKLLEAATLSLRAS